MTATLNTVTVPYGRQWVDEDDIAAVAAVLRSDWLTTGPMVEGFEHAIADYTGAAHAVAVSSGTAALHAIMKALGIRLGDEVIVPAVTFVATANAVVLQGGIPIFADIEPCTMLIDPADVEAKITSRTKAVVAVDYAGQPCDYDRLRAITDRHGIALVADACHSLGASYKGRPSGTLADLTAFSFHPVKHITTGEGGMVTTHNPNWAERMRRFRNHGIATDHRQRAESGSWYYEMQDLGCNYRITDIQCALGVSQLRKLHGWIERRQEIAARYDAALGESCRLLPLKSRPDASHARHLYVVKTTAKLNRDSAFRAFRDEGIGVNVHYSPVHLHPYYQRNFGTGPGLCPHAEKVSLRLLSLPMFPRLHDDEIDAVIAAAHKVGSMKGDV